MNLTAPDQREFERVMSRRAGRAVPDDVRLNALARRRQRIDDGIALGSLSIDELLAEILPVAGAATNFTLTLDTTAPADVTVSIDSGAAYSGDFNVDLTIATSDSPTTGYTMKVYGDVDDAADTARYRALEANAPWVTYSTSMAGVILSSGDGSKTVKVKVRDDVWNVSSEATDSITVDTSAPVPTISVAPDATKISKISGKRTSNFSWQADVTFDEYKIKVVPATNSVHTAGTTIPTTNGSTNMTGSAGGYPATTNIDSSIDGRDLELADAGDGAKIVKIFVKDASGLWST